MTEIARSHQVCSEIELFLSRGKYDDAKVFLAQLLQQSPLDRESKLYLLLVNVTLDGPGAYEDDIDQLRSLPDISDIEKSIVRRLFNLGFKSAEKEGREDQAWAYQRLLRRLLLNQPLDYAIPKSAVGALPKHQVPVSEVIEDSPIPFRDRGSGRQSDTATKLVAIAKERCLLFLSCCRRALQTTQNLATWKSNFAPQTALIVASAGLLIIPMLYVLSVHVRTAKEMPSYITAVPRPPTVNDSVPAVDVIALSGHDEKAENGQSEQVQNLVNGQLVSLREAYRKWIQKNPNLMGSLLVKMELDPAGNVVKAEDVASRLRDPAFLAVVLSEVRKWKFPQANLAGTGLTLPLVFLAKDMDRRTIIRWEQALTAEAQAKTILPSLQASSSTVVVDRRPTVKSNPQIADLKTPRMVDAAAGKLRKSEEPPRHAIDYKAQRIVRLRHEPRFAAATTDDIDPGTAISVLEAKGDWLKVKTRPAGRVGYVRKEYIVPLSAP